MLCPVLDVAGEDDRAPADVDLHVTVVGNQRAAVEGPPNEQLDIGRLDAGDDADLIADVTDADQPADYVLDGGALLPGLVCCSPGPHGGSGGHSGMASASAR